MAVQPYRISVPQPVLDDVRNRLSRIRWPGETENAGWDMGANLDYMREFCAYWQILFDWRRQEEYLNSFPQFRAEVDGIGIHFIHLRGEGPDPIPIVLTHGWPDSFARFLKLIPLLVHPEADSEPSFDVIVPSLPGFGFSDKPTKPGMSFNFADLIHKLMTQVLGYSRYAAHGGDWGGMVTEHLARSYSKWVIGIHLTDVPFYHSFQKPSDPTSAEKNFLEKMENFPRTEGAYAMIQGTRPQTLAYGLTDSPAGLAAWLVEKFRSWSDCHGDVEKRFTKDELLTNVMIYWVTSGIDSSFLPYYDLMHAGAVRWGVEAVKSFIGSSDVPAAFALFPKDLSSPPREWAERFFNVQRWTEMPRGGHFAAMEEPELLAEDLRLFFGSLCNGNRPQIPSEETVVLADLPVPNV